MKVFGISVLIFLIIIESSVALFKVTNIKCKCYDHSFCEFPQCELKVLGRGKVGIFIYAKMNQLPLKEVMINMSLFRKFNGYRPFMYKITVDFCSYMKNRKRYPWVNIVHSGIISFSNINHSCPYNHDLIVSNMVLDDEMLEKTPFPTGSYMLQLIAGTPSWQGMAQVMVDIVEEEWMKKRHN